MDPLLELFSFQGRVNRGAPLDPTSSGRIPLGTPNGVDTWRGSPGFA